MSRLDPSLGRLGWYKNQMTRKRESKGDHFTWTGLFVMRHDFFIIYFFIFFIVISSTKKKQGNVLEMHRICWSFLGSHSIESKTNWRAAWKRLILEKKNRKSKIIAYWSQRISVAIAMELKIRQISKDDVKYKNHITCSLPWNFCCCRGKRNGDRWVICRSQGTVKISLLPDTTLLTYLYESRCIEMTGRRLV